MREGRVSFQTAGDIVYALSTQGRWSGDAALGESSLGLMCIWRGGWSASDSLCVSPAIMHGL